MTLTKLTILLLCLVFVVELYAQNIDELGRKELEYLTLFDESGQLGYINHLLSFENRKVLIGESKVDQKDRIYSRYKKENEKEWLDHEKKRYAKLISTAKKLNIDWKTITYKDFNYSPISRSTEEVYTGSLYFTAKEDLFVANFTFVNYKESYEVLQYDFIRLHDPDQIDFTYEEETGVYNIAEDEMINENVVEDEDLIEEAEPLEITEPTEEEVVEESE